MLCESREGCAAKYFSAGLERVEGGEVGASSALYPVTESCSCGTKLGEDAVREEGWDECDGQVNGGWAMHGGWLGMGRVVVLGMVDGLGWEHKHWNWEDSWRNATKIEGE